MKKAIFWSTIVVVVVALVFIIVTKKSVRAPTISEQPANFQVNGILVRNLPGLKSNVWYFSHRHPGTTETHVEEVIFNSKSQCIALGLPVDCSNLPWTNGQSVFIEGYDNEPKDTLLTVFKLLTNGEPSLGVVSPAPYDVVTGSFKVKGRARGSWFFEAVFPMRLFDESGKVITSTFVRAKGDWMTDDYVPFEGEVRFTVSTTTNADLVLANDNPSGDPARSKTVHIPLVLKPPSKR